MKKRHLIWLGCLWASVNAWGGELHDAAEAGDARRCLELLRAGANANEQNEQGETPLISWLFVAEDKNALPDELIRATNLSAQDASGCTALHYAATEEAPELCRRLLQAGASAQAADAEGNTPLHYAAREGHEEVCRLLIEGGAHPEAENKRGETPADLALATGHSIACLPPPRHTAPTAGENNTRLQAAVERMFSPEGGGLSRQTNGPEWRFVQELQEHSELCSKGAERAQDFPYLLYYCVVSHHQNRPVNMELVQELLAAGADVNTADEAGATAFHWAIATAQSELCHRLLHLGAGADGWPPLHLAALLGKTEECHNLIAAGENPNAQNSVEWTPLMYAARFGRTETCRTLLADGAQPTLGRGDGLTPLHTAAEQGHAEVCRLLLAAGAQADATLDGDLTPLYLAVCREHTEACRALLEGGANVNKRRQKNERESVLSWAIALESAELCNMLLSAGADANAADAEGNTPLHHVALVGNLEIAKLLLAAGADPAAKNNYELLPADIASQEGHSGLSLLLRP